MIGVGFNQGNEGLSGSVMRNLETGDDDFKIKFLKKFADGGRIGFNEGSSVMSILKSKGGAGKGILGTELGYDGLMSLMNLLQNSGLFADGGRAGYNEGSMVLPKPKPKPILPENAAAESGQAITRNNPVADLIEKYYLYQKSMPGVSKDTQIYLIEDFKNSLNKSGISQEDFMMRLSEDKEMRSEGGRIGYGKGKLVLDGITAAAKFLNKKSPLKAYKDYLKSVKDRVKAGKEAEVAGEVIPVAAGGALVTNQVKKKLKKMNEEYENTENKATGGIAGMLGE